MRAGPLCPGGVTCGGQQSLVFTRGHRPPGLGEHGVWAQGTDSRPSGLPAAPAQEAAAAGGAARPRVGAPGSHGAGGGTSPGLGEPSWDPPTLALPCPAPPPDSWVRAVCAWGRQGCHQAGLSPGRTAAPRLWQSWVLALCSGHLGASGPARVYGPLARRCPASGPLPAPRRVPLAAAPAGCLPQWALSCQRGPPTSTYMCRWLTAPVKEKEARVTHVSGATGHQADHAAAAFRPGPRAVPSPAPGGTQSPVPLTPPPRQGVLLQNGIAAAAGVGAQGGLRQAGRAGGGELRAGVSAPGPASRFPSSPPACGLHTPPPGNCLFV